MATGSGPAERYSITIEGWKHIKDMLAEDDLLQEPWSKAMDAIGVIGEQYAIKFAPMRKGATIAKMSYRVQKKPIPLYVVIKTTARSPKGYSYPRLHEYSRRSPHYGWMYRAMQQSKGLWAGVMDDTVKKIERKWSSH